jgi:hypothetical protein
MPLYLQPLLTFFWWTKKRRKYLKKYLAGKSGSVTFVTPRNWKKEVL